ncbi:DinB family protein [candidate division GN15 bacterium]|nr:DinB family protein [candidate division GN15 bacterium]
MDSFWKETIWGQFGAAIDSLENAIRACPDDVWLDDSSHWVCWYATYHTLFWLDLYLDPSPDTFRPPEPFTMDELDPRGLIPEKPYTKEAMLAYLAHGRSKCRSRIEAMDAAEAQRRWVWGPRDLSVAELLLYNMRHVQHHTAQFNLILRQRIDSAPGWVSRAK